MDFDSSSRNFKHFQNPGFQPRLIFNPIPAGGGMGGKGPPCSFFTLLKKYWSEAVEIFRLFLNTHNHPFRFKTGSFILTAGVLKHTAWMTTFLYYKLNLCFDPLSVARFWEFVAFWKAFDIRKRFAQVLQRIFANYLQPTRQKKCAHF